MKRVLKTVELFSGGQSFSKIMRAHGHRTFTVDIEDIVASDGGKTDLVKDIFDVHSVDLPNDIDILWASPPCVCFSPASLHYYWNSDGSIRKEHYYKVRVHIEMVNALMRLIERLCNWNHGMVFFVENPVGKMRRLSEMKKTENEILRKEITYCQYGDERMKPTDIWTNAFWWKPRPACKRGDPCHRAAPGGRKVDQYTLEGEEVKNVGGVDGRGKNFTTTDKLERAAIPPALFEEILEQMPAE